jgi:UDP-N-acetylmuramate dehydrogenase
MLNIQKNIPMAPFTTFRIGGPAKFFVEVSSTEELAEAIEYAQDNKLEFFVSGGGSNVLVSDDGFDGLVIRIKNNLLVVHKDSIGCGSGLALAEVVRESADRGLAGLEWATGIPGAIGGAIRGNAGAFGSEMAAIVDTVNAIDVADLYEEENNKRAVKIKTFKREECLFNYRDSIFKNNRDLIIISAVLQLVAESGEAVREKMQETLEQRLSKQPKESSAGSFFKNPMVSKQELIDEFKQETGASCNDGRVAAGWIIARADLLGKKMGGAMVSKKHANFIVNTGDATAEDVIMLVSYVKQQVRDKFGIELQEEVQYVGF